jgi:hypothetical protein
MTEHRNKIKKEYAETKVLLIETYLNNCNLALIRKDKTVRQFNVRGNM